jgi:hypothetical protein
MHLRGPPCTAAADVGSGALARGSPASVHYHLTAGQPASTEPPAWETAMLATVIHQDASHDVGRDGKHRYLPDHARVFVNGERLVLEWSEVSSR